MGTNLCGTGHQLQGELRHPRSTYLKFHMLKPQTHLAWMIAQHSSLLILSRVRCLSAGCNDAAGPV